MSYDFSTSVHHPSIITRGTRYSLVLHVHGSHMCNLRHIRVVEGHVEEDCRPQYTREDEQDHCKANEHLTDIIQGALPVLVIEHEQRLDDVVPDDPERID